jgi:ATP-dependent protease Clp ATPase subunit
MMSLERTASSARCSFCGATRDEVLCLIDGPRGISICDHCVDVCADQVAKARAGEHADLCRPQDEPAQRGAP